MNLINIVLTHKFFGTLGSLAFRHSILATQRHVRVLDHFVLYCTNVF